VGEALGPTSGDPEAPGDGDGSDDAELPELTPKAGAPLGSPGMLYSAFHGDSDGSVDWVAGETPWLAHLAWYGSPW
jgi:hypothetical protein